MLCSRDLDVLRAQRIIGFFNLITHKTTRSEISDHVASTCTTVTVKREILSGVAFWVCRSLQQQCSWSMSIQRNRCLAHRQAHLYVVSGDGGDGDDDDGGGGDDDGGDGGDGGGGGWW